MEKVQRTGFIQIQKKSIKQEVYHEWNEKYQ